MSERKNISAGLRYKILKRDNFTCQYCGRSAPKVTLEIEHLNPVAKGGTNEPYNLITSCEECNRGKGTDIYKCYIDSPIGQRILKEYGILHSINPALHFIGGVTVEQVLNEYGIKKRGYKWNG